jgi:ACS family hexuronate transporter-like MFS transporter
MKADDPYVPPHASETPGTEQVVSKPAQRTQGWIWWVSGLLLLATMLNYMDRQTLANLAPRISSELKLSNEQYGDMEFGFGCAFAAGSLFFGFLADRVSVAVLYPLVLLAWSSIGVITGFCNGYESLLLWRTLLGFFEAGHWPCALRTTKAVMGRQNRTMGNSVLQSGGALGAILTPPIILLIVGKSEEAGAWRSPFIIIGSLGIIWIVAWMASIRRRDIPIPSEQPANEGEQDRGFLRECLSNRRFWTLVPVVIFINLTWQLIRAWLPKFLMEGRGATETVALLFNSVYYIAADVGCILAGVATLRLARRGLHVHTTRMIVFGSCALLTALTCVAAALPLGWGLYSVLLIVAAGSLGLFPCYYSLSQETSERHMGKTAGLLGALAWIVSSPMQKVFGRVVDQTKSFDTGLALAGFAPAAAFIVLLLFWPRESSADTIAAQMKEES